MNSFRYTFAHGWLPHLLVLERTDGEVDRFRVLRGTDAVLFFFCRFAGITIPSTSDGQFGIQLPFSEKIRTKFAISYVPTPFLIA